MDGDRLGIIGDWDCGVGVGGDALTTLKDVVIAYVLNCRRCYGYTPDAREVAAVLHLRGSKTILETVSEAIKRIGR